MPEKSAPNRPIRHTLIRDIAAGPNGDIRLTETMEVEIIWPADRSGWNAGGGDWRVLNPPPIGYYVTGADELAADAAEPSEVDAARGDLKAFDSIRLLAEVRRLRHLHDLDHKLADHWQAEAGRFEGMWRMECDLAASRVQS